MIPTMKYLWPFKIVLWNYLNCWKYTAKYASRCRCIWLYTSICPSYLSKSFPADETFLTRQMSVCPGNTVCKRHLYSSGYNQPSSRLFLRHTVLNEKKRILLFSMLPSSKQRAQWALWSAAMCLRGIYSAVSLEMWGLDLPGLFGGIWNWPVATTVACWKQQQEIPYCLRHQTLLI